MKPVPSVSAMSKICQRIRAEKVEAFSINGGLEDMIIPEEFTKTFKGKMFLLHDSQDGRNRFLLQNTSKNLRFLETLRLVLLRYL